MWQSHLIQKGTEPYVMAIIKREFLDMEAKDWLASLCITERNWTLGRKKIDSGHKLTLDVPHVLGWKPTALAWSSKASSWPSKGSEVEGDRWRRQERSIREAVIGGAKSFYAEYELVVMVVALTHAFSSTRSSHIFVSPGATHGHFC
jgi:hypothetical protein